MISPQVIQELLTVRQVLHYLPASPKTEKGWTQQEQQLFWDALAKFPQGPWTTIAEYIGTKSTRQAMTHGQKLRQKLNRWRKRLRRTPAAAVALAEDPELLDDDVKATIALSSVMMTSSAMPTTSGMMMMRNTSPVMTSASMAMSMAMPTLSTTSGLSSHHAALYLHDVGPPPQYRTRPRSMLPSTSFGLEPITTTGLSDMMSYSELLMASLPFASSGISSFASMPVTATTSASFDRMAASTAMTMTTTTPSLPASFVSSERLGQQTNPPHHHHQAHRRPAAMAAVSANAAAALPAAFGDDDGVRYALPQSMVDDLADVLWDY